MSRKLFAFLLAELKTLRFICKKCDVACEVPLAQVGQMFNSAVCKNCQARFVPSNMARTNALVDLAAAIELMQHPDVTSKLDVELVVPDSTPNV